MNKLLKELLPKEFKWVDLSTLSEKELLYLSTSFKNILISKEKRGNDLDIIPGWIQPINDCTDFKIISNQGGNEYLNN